MLKPNLPSILNTVKDGQLARFEFYRGGNLWYKAENGFEFPVPIADIGDAVFKVEEKALLLMRYIRKHRDLIRAGMEEGKDGGLESGEG